MAAERKLPDDAVEFIKLCVRQSRIRWTYHVNMRLEGRYIPRRFIVGSTDNYEIIESYPEDKYFPSYLVYSHYQERFFHVLFACDLEGNNVRVITAYCPDLDQWEADLKTRRPSV
ncbi:MAG: DUF4258 domain-containing protein [Thermodesulfobacteriota bacterium]